MNVREKSNQNVRIHFDVLRDEIGVPHKTADFKEVLEKNREVCPMGQKGGK